MRSAPQVVLSTPAEGATDMNISGDVVTDANTFHWVAYVSTVPLDLTSGDGEKFIVVAVRDEAGNESATKQVSVFLDTTPPLQSQLTPDQIVAGRSRITLVEDQVQHGENRRHALGQYRVRRDLVRDARLAV